MNNKVAALTVAFNEPRLLPVCVRQFKKPYLDEDIYHIVLISNKPWHGDFSYDNKGYSQAKGADHIIVDNWKDQSEQFNFGLEVLRKNNFEWAIICDADEFYTSLGINVLLEDIDLFSESGQIRAPLMEVYWKLPIFRIYNKQQDTPVVAISTSQIFSNKRTPSLSEYGTTSAILHHFSYVRSNEEMYKKIKSFEHSHEFDTDKWFNEVWLNWEINNKNLHPVVPEQFSHAIYKPAPQKILNNFYAEKEHHSG